MAGLSFANVENHPEMVRHPNFLLGNMAKVVIDKMIVGK